ncbi:MAG TPA: prolipoprotein diacylglyceryl transferase family protein [Desulfomonilia bacterium]
MVFGMAVAYVLLRSLKVPVFSIMIAFASIIVLCLPAAAIVARIIEGKKHTFTVGGASFIGIILAPWIFLAIDSFEPIRFNVPVMAVLAAMSIGYAFGEGMGRLACISFGCCYGKPLKECSAPVRKLFSRFHFVFHGDTKKIAYSQGLDGHRVVPVQAVTAIILSVTGITGTIIFLSGAFSLSFTLTVCTTQIWRILSEFLRADFRGHQRFSAYQAMAVIAALSSFAVSLFLKSYPVPVDMSAGLLSLWSPGVIILFQAAWLASFLYTGRSTVTGSRIHFHVMKDRI